MNRCRLIRVVFVLAFAACTHPDGNAFVESRSVASQTTMPSPEWVAIDSLMWQRPDSALTRLLSFCDDNRLDTCGPLDKHCFHLLLADALFKNGYEQTNAKEIVEAARYCDSCNCVGPAEWSTFMAARAHYLCGIGYQENDSALLACKEYFKVLDLLDGGVACPVSTERSANLLGLAYSRLGEVFYYYGLPKSAVEAYRSALECFHASHNATNEIHSLRWMANSYRLDAQNDSSLLYFEEAKRRSADLGDQALMDVILAEAAPVYYDLGWVDEAFVSIRESLCNAQNDNQYYARCFTLGSFYLKEGAYDSAVCYLEQSARSDMYDTHTASDEMLAKAYGALGDSTRALHYQLQYAADLRPFVDKFPVSIELANLYETYRKDKDTQRHEEYAKYRNRRLACFVAGTAVFILLLVTVFGKSVSSIRKKFRKRFGVLEERISKAQGELKEKEKALSVMARKVEIANFADEPVCRRILKTVHEVQFLPKVEHPIYKEHALSQNELLALRNAVDRHYGHFTTRIRERYPELTDMDIDYCCLYLLGLKNADCAALMQKAYPTVCERSRKLKAILGSTEPLADTLRKIVTRKRWIEGSLDVDKQ